MTTKALADRHMSFWEHLEELRWVLIKSIATLAFFSVLGWAVTNPLASLLRQPLQAVEPPVELVFSAPLDAFLSRLKLAILGGLFFSLPFILFFIWSFVAPGLERRERRIAWIAIIAGTLMFVLGAFFGYRLLHFGLPALVRMGLSEARNLWVFRIYLDFCLKFILAFGVIFEMPVVLVALGRLGLTSAGALRRFRPYAAIAIFIVAAILTPPDPMTQLLLGLPLLCLYELSIALVACTASK